MEKMMVLFSLLLLICSCNDHDSILIKESLKSAPNVDPRYNNTVELVVGEPIQKSSILNNLSDDYLFNKISSVEDCGGFLADDENENEDINQVGNMIIHTMNDLAVISKVVHVKEGSSFNYKGLIIDSYLTPDNINHLNFEVSEPEYNIKDEMLAIETTNITTPYDKIYQIRQVKSDDLLNLFFLNKRVVGFEIISQC